MSNIQTSKLLKTAINLQSIIKAPLARKVLEIDLTAESSNNENLLNRLIRSLNQYVNKKKNIIYVGLVGHYSSGKSSTLNSLLELKGSNNERATGLNPTDKAITLITHPKNSNSLVLMSREGINVPVRSIFIEHEMLKEIVISDTPGSGDPHIVNEMIQDFLPICDFIFYFISSTNPIDQADLPLLEQKSKKLPFIPVKYIITRADEFRINKNQDVSHENIDSVKKDTFTGKLISRFKKIVSSEDINIEDFIFVDNESKFNIDLLRKNLHAISSHLDSNELLKIHGYKTEYYKTNLNQIYLFYTKTIDEKIRQSKGYEKTASENITRFDKSVEMNNEKLRLLWSKGQTKFKEEYSNEVQNINAAKLNRISKQLSDHRELINIKASLFQKTESLSNGYHGKIVQDLNSLIKESLRDIKHSILDNINKGALLNDNLSNLFPSRIGFSPSINKIEIDYSKLNDYLASYKKEVIDLLKDSRQVIRFKIKEFITTIEKEMTLTCLENLYKNGSLSINENFDKYFERIQMYRSTVLTRNTKETIEKLRIGIQLDELDEEFEEDFINEMKTKAINNIYIKNSNDLNKFRTKKELYISKISDIKIALNKITIKELPNGSTLTKEEIDVSDLITQLTNSREENANKVYQVKLNNILSSHKEAFDIHKKNLKQKKQNRNRSIIKWTILVGFLFLISYGLLYYFNYVVTSTITAAILTSIAANLIGNLVGFIFAKFRLDLNKIEALSNSEFVAIQKSKLLHEFDENFWIELSNNGTDENMNSIPTSIKKAFNTKLISEIDTILTHYQSIQDSFLKEKSNFLIFVDQYQKDISDFFNKFNLVFSEQDHNSSEIIKITKHIKEVSIKPSFSLLAETTKNLELVKSKIHSISE